MSYIKVTKPLLGDLTYSKDRELLLVNQLGAYCSTTVSTCNTRKYHGLLVAPQPDIDDQAHILLSHLDENVIAGDKGYGLAVHQFPDVHFPQGQQYLDHFTLEDTPRWTYNLDDGAIILEKEIVLVNDTNRLLIKYKVVEAKNGKFTLQLRPFLAFRNSHAIRHADFAKKAEVDQVSNGISLKMHEEYSTMFFQHSKKGSFAVGPDWYHSFEYEREKERGYDYRESLFLPGFFEFEMKKGDELIFAVGTSEANSRMLKRDFTKEKSSVIPRNDFNSTLANAAGQFIVQQGGKMNIVAGWPWFGRWGRDTFIALPGLTLSTGRPELFKLIIDSMMMDLKDGLFPNAGAADREDYNSADAPLWCIWALQQYAYYQEDISSVWASYGDKIIDILEAYKKGTRYNIRMTEAGLITASDTSLALTWMDAIVDGYPVTPRAGMPVEINALWYNAVNFALEAAVDTGDQEFISEWENYPQRIRNSFMETFWDENKGYLADCVTNDDKDWSFRPNQIFAVSLPYSPVTLEMAEEIVEKVKNDLLTPRGLRTLSPNDPNYKGTYFGDQIRRDEAYHQGTVWPWLLGHFADAYMKVRGKDAYSHLEEYYKEFEPAIVELGLGFICEVYNGEEPYQPGGTIAQAWSVAEVIRMKELMDTHKISGQKRMVYDAIGAMER